MLSRLKRSCKLAKATLELESLTALERILATEILTVSRQYITLMYTTGLITEEELNTRIEDI